MRRFEWFPLFHIPVALVSFMLVLAVLAVRSEAARLYPRAGAREARAQPTLRGGAPFRRPPPYPHPHPQRAAGVSAPPTPA